MNRVALVLPFLIACVGLDEEDDFGEVESAGTSYQGTSYQGTSYQGTSYQGTSYQGTSYQGTSYQGTSYQGATFGGATLEGKVTKTTIETWRKLANGNWEQRLPDAICNWNSAKTAVSCSTVNLATTPSPLAGVKFQATFYDQATGTTRQGTLRIGSGTSDLTAVSKDTTVAMHPLNGAGVPGAALAYFGCTHPDGCRKNADLWNYRVELLDGTTAVSFCKTGETALALAGTWDLTGARITTLTNTTTTAFGTKKGAGQFTFACTNGTIAKCTRWGYRPFGVATKTGADPTTVALADYHQACVRAATADYCANGRSFTKDGTLIDIYDYQPHQSYASGFIPRTLSLFYQSADPPTAFAWESMFDKLGGAELDFLRYTDLGNLQGACPGKFSLGTAPQPGDYHIPASRGPTTYVAPFVSVDTTTTCSHDETTLGRALHPNCSKCTYKLWEQLGEHPCLRSAWDESCRKLALDRCTVSERMATHSECSTGGPLHLYDSACTLNICGDPQYASCCTSGWTSTCVNAANARCTGGQEHGTLADNYGFCNIHIPLVFQTF